MNFPTINLAAAGQNIVRLRKAAGLSVNKQGNDTGIQYRTGIYCIDEEQLSGARQVYAAEEEKAGALTEI